MFINFYIIGITSVIIAKSWYWEKLKKSRKAVTKQAFIYYPKFYIYKNYIYIIKKIKKVIFIILIYIKYLIILRYYKKKIDKYNNKLFNITYFQIKILSFLFNYILIIIIYNNNLNIKITKKLLYLDFFIILYFIILHND